jgi:peptidyl-prolyl cis-trans isomerase D
LADAAEAHQLKARETIFFARQDRVDGIKQPQEFAKLAFELSDDEVSEPTELTDGYYVLEVIDRKPATIPELAGVEEKVRSDLIGERQDQLARKNAEQFLTALKNRAEFQAEVKSRKLEAKTTGFFKRFGSIPGIGFEQELLDAAFSLDPSGPLPEAVIKGSKGYYVIRLQDRQEAEVTEFEAKKSDTKSGILSQKRQTAMDEWFAQLRQQSEITIQEGFLE